MRAPLLATSPAHSFPRSSWAAWRHWQQTSPLFVLGAPGSAAGGTEGLVVGPGGPGTETSSPPGRRLRVPPGTCRSRLEPASGRVDELGDR